MEGVLGFVLLALWIWAIVDCITSDSSIIRNLPTVEGEPRTYPTRRTPAIEDRADFASGISDRRSAELDRQLDAWEKEHALPAAGTDDIDARARALDEREAELRRRELELRSREL